MHTHLDQISFLSHAIAIDNASVSTIDHSVVTSEKRKANVDLGGVEEAGK